MGGQLKLKLLQNNIDGLRGLTVVVDKFIVALIGCDLEERAVECMTVLKWLAPG